MNDFDQKRAADHLDLYRSDGRFYDLSEKDGVLTLQLRRTLVWEWSLILALIVLIGWILAMVLAYRTWHSSPTKTNLYFELLEHSAMSLIIYLGWHPILITSQRWVLDKVSGKIRCGPTGSVSLASIYGVKAWRKGTKFYLALKSKTDKPRQLGRFGFCRSEHAWRHDAAQIAAFLGVPLEIPPVIPA